ncbi:arabinose-proton symporter [Alicyclobacillus hesperidum]|uniref:Arabinose-proton symporter n=1 Tax=Alicyclobacillus hesperidum TaxID=89784 RepID=A0A1H2Y1N4_9BACL|nr:sugar porter family MFS transporter [Alicyclobacillus hesperidum]GLV14902.1 arabinose-proton symporter [Alicyclobacillus hesperidum]SDW99057.1 MFS transporter, SP family, arabinose:H+ symporter [Alicyclobacillus hesperidum]
MSRSISQGRPQQTGSALYVVMISCAAALGGLLYGYDTAVISGAIGFLKTLYNLSAFMQGLVISSIMIGGVIGVGVSGFMSDRIGRRKVLMTAAFLFAIAAIVSAFSSDVTVLIVARIIGGLGIGMGSSLSVTYISECAPPRIRGALSSLYQLLTIIGISATYVTNFLIQRSGTVAWDTHTGWRWMLGLGAVPAAIFFFVLLFAPESPRWLVKAGRSEQSLAILTKINGESVAKTELQTIEDSLRNEASSSVGDLLKPGLRKALVVGILLALFNQVIGMNAVTYYGPEIFKMVGFGLNSDFSIQAFFGAMWVVFTVVAVFLIDRVGRRRLMQIGSALMAIFMALMGATFFFHISNGFWLILFIMGFTAAFSVSMGPIPWIMIPEIFPNHLRARAAGVATIFLWGANWAIGQFTPMLLNGLGGADTFWIFAAINVVCFVFVSMLVPETKNKSLEEIEQFWMRGKASMRKGSSAQDPNSVQKANFSR